MENRVVQLSHGGGGEEMDALIKGLFFKHFSNEILLKTEDAAILDVEGRIAFTTDSYTVTPLFFRGGDIGKIAVAGTVNDLSMMGAKPLYLSCSFIIEEGFEFESLERVVVSMADELKKSGAMIVCGDTKVVSKGSVDKLFINTSGIGVVQKNGISSKNIKEGDAIIVSNDIGRHGATLMIEREGFESKLESDCASLWVVVDELIKSGVKIKAMRDATRGGVSAVLNELSVASEVCIEVDEGAIPIADEVRGVCEMLGFEPLDFANEGTFVIAVDATDALKTVDILKGFEICKNASVIAKTTLNKPKKVILKTEYGGSRYIELPKGELLPRIC